MKLADQQVIYVPVIGEEVTEINGQLTAGNSNEAGKININTADLAELQTLSGIGEKKAQDILNYRETHGSFSTIDELTNVSGIGDKTLEKLREHITV